jgi:hypothetical protein
MTDHPRLRAFGLCPLCGDAKPRFALCCWSCFNARGIGAGDADPWAEAQFDRAEATLANAARDLERKIDVVLGLGTHSIEHTPSRVLPLVGRSRR